jgi:Lamin Tail Domain
LGNSNQSQLNGQVSVDYVFSSRRNSLQPQDQLILYNPNGRRIDYVDWSGRDFPRPTSGATMALRSVALDNSVGAHWCTSSRGTFGRGDYGTPGRPNDCVENDVTAPVPLPTTVQLPNVDSHGNGLKFNEIMTNPTKVQDVWGEWIELYNGGPRAVNLLGWSIADVAMDDAFVIRLDVIVAPNGYAVLGSSGRTELNGGIPRVDYVYAWRKLSLARRDTLVLLNPNG